MTPKEKITVTPDFFAKVLTPEQIKEKITVKNFFNDTATTEIYTLSIRRQRQMCIRDSI